MVWKIFNFYFPHLWSFCRCSCTRSGRRMSRFYMVMTVWRMPASSMRNCWWCSCSCSICVCERPSGGVRRSCLSTVLPSSCVRSGGRQMAAPHPREPKDFRACGIRALAAAFVPHLYTMAVTAGLILLAALFYPSHTVLSGWKDEKTRELGGNTRKCCSAIIIDPDAHCLRQTDMTPVHFND